MKSKILAAVPDPFSPSTAIFIAESAGFARRIHLTVSFQYLVVALCLDKVLTIASSLVQQKPHIGDPKPL